MTVRDYVSTHEYEGRTVLLGTLTQPVAWLAQPNILAPHHALCFDRIDAITAVHYDADIKHVKRLAKSILFTHPCYHTNRLRMPRTAA